MPRLTVSLGIFLIRTSFMNLEKRPHFTNSNTAALIPTRYKKRQTPPSTYIDKFQQTKPTPRTNTQIKGKVTLLLDRTFVDLLGSNHKQYALNFSGKSSP